VDADLVELHGSTLHSLLLNGHSREMVIDREGDRVFVWLDGEKIETTVRDEVSRALASVLKGVVAGPSKVEAPMPGVVVSVPVKVGDVVAVGQPVVVVEAMKMQNELLAETAGVVDSIAVKPGQTVDRGAILVSIRGEDADGAAKEAGR
jgi:biotin carboxyl carrier protein